jgi:hypothetical protein
MYETGRDVCDEDVVERRTCDTRGCASVLPHVVTALEEEMGEEDDAGHRETVEELDVGDGSELEGGNDKKIAFDVGESESGHEQLGAERSALRAPASVSCGRNNNRRRR